MSDWQPLLLSLQVATCATALAGVIGIALAALLSRPKMPGAELLDALVTAPLVLPPTVLGYYVLVVLGRRSPLGQLIEAWTGSPIVFTRTGAVIAATLTALPFVTKSARSALQEVDTRLMQAAATLGAGPWRRFLVVRLPLASRGIVAGLTLGFAKSLGDFGVTLMVAGNIPGQTQTASLAIYDAISAGRDSDAAGMAAVLCAIAIAALYGVNHLVRRSHAA